MAEANPFSVIQFIAEQRIAEAQAQGVFDNLPGTGRPLELEDMSHVPEELRMAYKILSNAGCLPPELEQRKELNRLVDLLEQCEDEQERVRQMQRLRFMITRAQIRFQRPIHLEQDDPYYDRLLERLSRADGQSGKAGGKPRDNRPAPKGDTIPVCGPTPSYPAARAARTSASSAAAKSRLSSSGMRTGRPLA